MSFANFAELERDIGNHKIILNILKELYMDSRQNNLQEPTVRQLFDMISYIHDQIKKKQCELKML